MSERTIRIAQRCSAEEAATIMAAISAFEDEGRPSRPGRGPSGPREAGRVSGPSIAPGSAPPGPGRSGTAIIWTRSEASLGRGT